MPKLKKTEKIMLILIVVGVVAFVIFDPYHLIRSAPVATVAARADSTQQAKAGVDTSTADLTDQTGTARLELQGWRRDPFEQTLPDIDQDAMVASLRLTAISLRGDDRMAMINSKPVRVGDEVQGLRVSQIESGRVMLESGGQSYTLTWER